MKIVAAASVLLAVVVSIALPATGGRRGGGRPPNCGLTTLQGTFDVSGLEEGKVLVCGPGEKIKVRTRLQKPKAGRADRRRPLISFFTIADVQLADEESPLRAEFLDKCEDHPASAAFRPQETMVPQLMNAHIRAANRIARRGSPITRDDFSFAIGLGDLADNNQFNEIRWIIDIFDGSKLVDPDSGDDGYEGVQATDPTGAPESPLESPVEGKSVLDLANEPFFAAGIRGKNGPLPWYSLPGNHDIKVQGTSPNEPGWREFANAWAQGSIKVTDTSPDQQQRGCEGGFGDPEYYQDVFTNPGGSKVIAADPDRRLLGREEWVEEHMKTTGIPEGHGYGGNRCTDENGELLVRACYSFDKGAFHFIGLDTNPDGGLEAGDIDDPQFQWLERELKANSRTYFDAEGKKQRNPDGRNRLIVVFTHHTISTTDNEEGEGEQDGADLRRLLLRYPNVIVQADGHTHQNKIWARRNKQLGTGYWEVNTSAIADLPHQSRTIEIVDNRDGTLSIFAVIFNAAIPPNVRLLDWEADDPTDETRFGAPARSNEDWLASAALEVGYYDPQTDLTKMGRRKDRNVELVIKAPFELRRR